MSEFLAVTVQMMVAFATLVGALTAAYVAWKSLHKSIENGVAIREVHLMVNSRLDQFIKLTEKASHAEGVKDERKSPGQG